MAATRYGIDDPLGEVGQAGEKKGAPGCDDEKKGPAVGERVSEAMGRAGEAARQTGKKAAEKLEGSYDQVAEEGERAIRSISSQVHEHPMVSLAVAFCAGVLITSLLKR